MGKPAPHWQDLEIVAQMIRLNDEGLSSSLIAEGLGYGISKGAVISKLRQLKIPLKHPASHLGVRRPRTPKAKPPGEQMLQAKSRPIPLPDLIEAKDIIPIGLSLMNLTDRHCHWPYGDGPSITFCGHSIAPGKNLCASHWQIAHPKLPATAHAKGSVRADRVFRG